MKRHANYLLAAALTMTELASCKKEATTPAPSKTDLLLAKTWQVTDIKVAGQSVFNPPFVDACDKDDLTKFNANKSVTFDEGSLKCDPTAAQTQTGSWDFTTNETKLKITDSSGAIVEGTIGTLNSTTLILTDPDIFGSGRAAEVTYTAQ